MSNRLCCGDRGLATAMHDPMALCPPLTPVLEARALRMATREPIEYTAALRRLGRVEGQRASQPPRALARAQNFVGSSPRLFRSS